MRVAVTLVGALTLAIFGACGGDDDSPEETLGSVTPVGTKETTATPVPDGGGGGPPAPVEPELDEELTELTRGEITATVDPSGRYDIDPETLAIDAGASASCDNFQFDFSWQVTDPYPPEGVTLAWQIQREGAPVQVAGGTAGNQAVGCGVLHAANQGAAPFTVAIKYLIGALE